MGWQLVLGGLPLLAGALRFEAAQPVTWNLTFVAVLLSLALPGTALAFMLWFSLLHRAELTRLNTFTFLTPVFDLIIGALFFAETLSLLELGGVFLILAGLAWISRQPPVQHKQAHCDTVSARRDWPFQPSLEDFDGALHAIYIKYDPIQTNRVILVKVLEHLGVGLPIDGS